MKTSQPALRFAWIHGARTDLAWYVGGPLVGWLFAAMVLLLAPAGGTQASLATVAIGGRQLDLTLALLVGGTWALFLSGPHVWATLARTVLDPDEWARRPGTLCASFALFALGPLSVLAPDVAAATGHPLSPGTAAVPFLAFLLLHHLWGYWHIGRQHWGFYQLYRRSAGERPGRGTWIEPTFFLVAFAAPIILLLSAPHGAQQEMLPLLSLQGSPAIRALCWAALAAAGALYLGRILLQLRAGEPVSGSKLLLLLTAVPLIYLAALHPLLALFFLPIVVSGHNVQYERLVWQYGRNKYFAPRSGVQAARRYRLCRLCFQGLWAYLGIGLLFTAIFFYGPLHQWINQAIGGLIDAVAFGSQGALGERLLIALAVGWSNQHYYLDSKIWHPSREPELAELLELQGSGWAVGAHP